MKTVKMIFVKKTIRIFVKVPRAVLEKNTEAPKNFT